MRDLPHVMGRIFNTPLMITAAKLDALLLALPQVLANRGTSMEAWDVAAPAEPRGAGYRMTPGGVAVLPVRGVLVRRPGEMSPDSTPLQSYERIGASIQKAMADQRVKGLLLELDSPGGESGSVFDLARQVRASGALKPIWAVADDAMYSAAYAIGSAASRVWATRTAGVGSIGVMALHADQSQHDAQEGVRYTYIHAGDRKIDGNPHAPLAPEAAARIQGEVNRLYGMFTDMVAAHRGMKPEAVREQQAGLYFAEDAVTAGLADQVGTAAEARQALADLVSPASSRSTSMTIEPIQPVMSEEPAKPADPPPAPPAPPTPPTPPAPDPAPQPAAVAAAAMPEPDSNVVHLDIAQVTAAQKRMDIEIAAACRIAGLPHLCEEMIASSMTVEQVGAELLRRKTAEADRQPITAIDPTQDPQPSNYAGLSREVYAARFPQRR
jgi:signal peptide peptidase SppA